MAMMIKKSLLVFLLLSYLWLSACSNNNNNSTGTIKVNEILMVNHRGANRLAPENTFAAARASIKAGTEYVEVDVRRSKDGVYYNFHDGRLERTTNGTGWFSETDSNVIDNLDAGAWFGHKFRGEKVPKMTDFLKWIHGQAKVYFDMKDVKLEEFVPYIYELGMENDCFFWFSDWQLAKDFRKLYPGLSLKINANSVDALDTLVDIYKPQIVECGIEHLSEEFIDACHANGLKVMPWIPGNDPEAYRIAIQSDIDLVNLDNPDIFLNMVKNNGVNNEYKLIAHRGGIVEDKYNEFDPKSIQSAIDEGYYMLEIDIWETLDGVLVVNHDPDLMRFFNDPRMLSDLTWDEIRTVKSTKGNYHPPLFEDIAKMCAGKVEIMIDTKVPNPTDEFYKKLEGILFRYDLLQGAYFIDRKAKSYFWGKVKFLLRVEETEDIFEKYREGEDVACHYFLFDDGAKMTSSLVKMCQKAHIDVVPSVNFGHYRLENPTRGAKRDIKFLKECGVTEFQIDSDFDDWLPH